IVAACPRSSVVASPAIPSIDHDAQPESAVRALHALDAHFNGFSPPRLIAGVSRCGVVVKGDHLRSPLSLGHLLRVRLVWRQLGVRHDYRCDTITGAPCASTSRRMPTTEKGRNT